jgi:hypothetical protein
MPDRSTPKAFHCWIIDGVLGQQYNPIAIAQYGLGNFNLYARDGDPERKEKFLRIANWLVEHLELNRHGLAMWMHHFDWEYRDTFRGALVLGACAGTGSIRSSARLQGDPATPDIRVPQMLHLPDFAGILQKVGLRSSTPEGTFGTRST